MLDLFFHNFTKKELGLLLTSWALLLVLAVISHSDFLSVLFSFLGIYCALSEAKGSIMGPIFAVVSIILYSIVAFRNRYYGEFVSRVFLMLPLALLTLYQWLRNTNSETKAVIQRPMGKKDWLALFGFCICASLLMYFILKKFNTERLMLSTFSMSTSICATYSLSRRNKVGFLFYLANNILSFVIWIGPLLAGDYSLLPMIFSPVIFFLSDGYAYLNWKKTE